MNNNKLIDAYDKQLFTDLKLILTDESNTITMLIHKIILFANCTYFEKMLTGYKEAEQNEIVIHVPNAYVAYDIIISFYGKEANYGNLPKWKHILETIICSDFLGIDCDSKLLENIIVPEEDFDLLLRVIQIVGYDEDTIKIINNNMPNNYDLSEFPDELIEHMINYSYSYNIASGSSDNSIKIWNPKNGELINT